MEKKVINHLQIALAIFFSGISYTDASSFKKQNCCKANIEITDECNKPEEDLERIHCPISSITPVRTILGFRSQGSNTARQIVGWQWEINKPFMCQNYSSYYLAYQFQQSFKNNRLANSLFGDTKLVFSGSLIPDRNNHQILADNFGLARNFKGEISFCPSFKSHIFDFGFYYGLDYYVQGAYFRLHAPIVHTIWHLKAKEKVENSGDKFFPACYVGPSKVKTAKSIKQALSGKFKFGDMKKPWCAGRFNFAEQKKTGLADIDLILGYNFINNDCYHIGVYLQSVLPTGPKPEGCTIFEPRVGNDGHFELGLGVSAHAVMWTWSNQNIALFFEGNLSHVFPNHQKRLFDFQSNGAFSRYLLLKDYNKDFAYNHKLLSATCTNFLDSEVKINAKADASLMIEYRYCNFGLDFGYNFFGQEEESIKLNSCHDLKRNLAIKGTEYVCCFNHQIAEINDTLFAEPNNVVRTMEENNPADCAEFPKVGQKFTVIKNVNNNSQPKATAFEPQPKKATAGTCNVCLNSELTQPTPVGELNINKLIIIESDKKPTHFVSRDNLDLNSASGRSVLTHKFFGHMFYTWYDSCGRNPHVGIGGEVEIEGGQRNDVICKRTGLNQWGVWVKAGFNF